MKSITLILIILHKIIQLNRRSGKKKGLPQFGEDLLQLIRKSYDLGSNAELILTNKSCK